MDRNAQKEGTNRRKAKSRERKKRTKTERLRGKDSMRDDAGDGKQEK